MKLRIENLLGVKRAEIDLDGIVEVVGPNASGKSSLAACAQALLAHEQNPLGVPATQMARVYLHDGEEIAQQVHLGFDLAATANVPILASNHGGVVHAEFLGIYGNCVVIDHGMGLQSLYGHLSSIGVQVGDAVEQGQEIGRSGMTGLAGGDHLHFTMLLHGRPVTPIEWWDEHWIEDRIARKIALASAR